MRAGYPSIILTFLILFGIGFSAHAQDKREVFQIPVTVIPGFEEEVYKYIREPDSTVKLEGAYFNRLLAMLYENDSTVLYTKDSSPMEDLFRSSFHWSHDTLVVTGKYGWYSHWYGFKLKIHKEKASVKYVVSVIDLPENAYYLNSERVYTLSIPCKEVQVVLNEMLDSNTLVLYGYVKFKSDEFLDNRTYDESVPKHGEGIRKRADMKIYFRSDRVD